jgi:hypothetical protein
MSHDYIKRNRGTANEVRQPGWLLGTKTEPKRRVLSDDKLDEVGAGLVEHSPRKSRRIFAQKTWVSKS